MNKYIQNFFRKRSCLLFCSFFILTGCQNNTIKDIQSEIDKISAEQIPDKRTGICTIKAEESDEAIVLRGETTSINIKNEIINTLSKQGIVLKDSSILLPDTIHNSKFRGLAALSVINLRKEPDHSAELVSQVILGTPLLILKHEGSWVLVQSPDNYIAWTEKSAVKMLTMDEIDDWKNSDRILFTANSGWIYCTPEDSCIVGDLVSGSVLVRKGEVKNFINVVFPDGREGFAEKKYFIDFDDFKERNTSVEGILKQASSLTGVPYLWGGSSSKGIDCSGFVQTVFFMNGIIMQRDASQQALQGSVVHMANGFEELRQGDLLFFGSVSNGKPRVTHVAIYRGDTEYIHSAGRVMVNSLDSTRKNYSSYRKNSLLKAVRIIGTDDQKVVSLKEHSWYWN